MTDEMIRELVCAVPMPAVLVDRNERIAAANADAQALLGQQITGRHFATILRQPQVIDAIEQTLKNRAPVTTRHLSNDGVQDTTFDVQIRPVGSLDAVLVCFLDITPVEQAGQMRRDFVANVSHELRTPLTALMGFIETLRGPAREDAAARDRFLGIMTDEANRMNRLVDDLLSLNRVESEERVRPKGRLDLVALLQRTLTSLRPIAEGAGVTLNLHAADQSVELTGDGDQIRQVFTNLIENAVKYGGSGGVVDLRLTTAEFDPAMRGPAVRIEVADSGPGIEAVHLPRLTERFYRADSHRSRQLGGTGLGLAIVKHIVNRHRGRLRVQSELGQGTTFTIILPR